jgi:hypothetical protein
MFILERFDLRPYLKLHNKIIYYFDALKTYQNHSKAGF